MQKQIKRLGTVAFSAVTILALSAVAAFATPATPVEQIMDSATTVVTDNVPLIAAGLAAILVVALGITALWAGFGNAKKGVKAMRG